MPLLYENIEWSDLNKALRTTRRVRLIIDSEAVITTDFTVIDTVQLLTLCREK